MYGAIFCSPAVYQVNESEAEKVLFEDRSPETFMVGSHVLHQIL